MGSSYIVCETCLTHLKGWANGRRKGMAFGIPLIWREPKDHVTDCYLCLVNTQGFNAKNKSKIEYPNLPSAIPPVTNCDEIPVPIFTKLSDPDDEDIDDSEDGMLDDELQDKSYIEELIHRNSHRTN